MRYRRPLLWIALVLAGIAVVATLVAAGVGLAWLVTDAAAMATLVVCLLVVVAIVATGARDWGPRTPYW